MKGSRGFGWMVVVLAGLGLATASGWAGDAKYLPADTEMMLSINIKQILESEVVKAQKDLLQQLKAAVENKLPGDNQAKKYLEKIGLDPLKDVTSFTVAHPGTKNPDAVCIIIEGNFNPEKFAATAEEAAKENGDVLRISKLGAVNMYEITPPGEKQFFVSLLHGKALVASPQQDILKEVVSRVAGTPKALKKEVRDLLKTTSDKQSLYFVVTGAALSKQAEGAPIPNAEAVGPVLQSLDGISGAITVAKDIQFQLGIGSKDEATAKKLVAGGNAGLLGLRIMVAQKAKENELFNPLVDVMNTLRIAATGNNMLITGEISYDNLEKMIKNFNKLKQP